MNLSLLPATVTTSETEGASSSSIAALFTDAGLPADFARLLGDQLGKELTALDASTLKSSLAATTDITADDDGGKSTTGSSKLNQLLAALGDISATLPAGLTHAGQTGDTADVKKTTVKDDSASDKTSDSTSLSALQTLLAMLPHQVATTLGSASRGQKTAIADSSNLSNAGSTQQDAATLVGLTSQDKGLAALIGSTVGNVKSDKTTAGSDLLPGISAKTKTTAQDKLLRLNAQDVDSSITAKATPLTAQVENALSGASADKTLLTSTTITPSLPPVSSLVMPATTSSLVSAPVSGHLSAQLGSQEWQQSLNQQVVMFSRNGQQNAELRLHPQELGALQISLKMDDNQAQLHFASAHSQVRAALEAAMPSLRSALAESGIQLGQSSVGSEGQWQQAQQQNQQNQQGFASGRQPAYGVEATADSLASTPLVTPAALQSLANGNGGVDIFA
ncbi:flagellar hook-length control protein FliK [Yersinia aldovae]|uniref:Flagellar hook-length control protein FliK n=1 Tax=Yersinia aldovae TaxID=29483 RepID=A0ABM9SSS7_YERAL|nr:flagellar hook-length control protein FliK [Yersinia aldovae]CNL00011.1 flagellar hook-length control protein FliK [Yersinia aldovae]